MKYANIILFAISIVLFSCKKEDKTPNNNTGNTIPITDGSISNEATHTGILTSGSYTTIMMNNTPIVSERAKAYFSSTPTQFMNSTTAIQVSKVFFNGDTLSYSSIMKYYDSYTPVNLSTETWSVVGANNIGSFSTSINAVTPGFDAVSIPDSVSKGSGFSVNINNVANTEKANVFLMDGTNTITGFVTKNLLNGNNNVTFSPSELNLLTTTNNGYFAIVLSSDKAFYFSGKSFQFVREAQYSKEIKIKP